MDTYPLNLPKRLNVSEVCPREGWQKFKSFIPTEKKIALVKRMVDSGAENIELGIVSNADILAWQFTDLETLLKTLQDYSSGKNVSYAVQVDNYETVIRARDMGFERFHFFVSASQRFSQVIANAPVEASLTELGRAMDLGLDISVGMGAALGCPFGEVIEDAWLAELIGKILELGVTNVSLADSGGICAPDRVRSVLKIAKKQLPVENIGMHLHQTRGLGLANTFAAMEEDIFNFDTSLGAMGGCPFIPGAKGNVATEDLLNMAKSMGMTYSQDYEATVEASLFQSNLIDSPVISSMATIKQASDQNCKI